MLVTVVGGTPEKAVLVNVVAVTTVALLVKRSDEEDTCVVELVVEVIAAEVWLVGLKLKFNPEMTPGCNGFALFVDVEFGAEAKLTLFGLFTPPTDGFEVELVTTGVVDWAVTLPTTDVTFTSCFVLFTVLPNPNCNALVVEVPVCG